MKIFHYSVFKENILNLKNYDSLSSFEIIETKDLNILFEILNKDTVQFVILDYSNDDSYLLAKIQKIFDISESANFELVLHMEKNGCIEEEYEKKIFYIDSELNEGFKETIIYSLLQNVLINDVNYPIKNMGVYITEYPFIKLNYTDNNLKIIESNQSFIDFLTDKKNESKTDFKNIFPEIYNFLILNIDNILSTKLPLVYNYYSYLFKENIQIILFVEVNIINFIFFERNDEKLSKHRLEYKNTLYYTKTKQLNALLNLIQLFTTTKKDNYLFLKLSAENIFRSLEVFNKKYIKIEYDNYKFNKGDKIENPIIVKNEKILFNSKKVAIEFGYESIDVIFTNQYYEELNLVKVLSMTIIKAIETEEKNIESIKNEERMDYALQAGNFGIFDWDLSHKKININKRLKDIMKLKTDIFLEEEFIKLIHPKDLPIVSEKIRKTILKETPYFEAEYKIKIADGTWKWIKTKGHIVEINKNQEPTRFLGLVDDIDELIRNRNLLEKKQYFDFLITSLLNEILSMPEDKLKFSVYSSLKRLTSFFKADSSLIVFYNKDIEKYEEFTSYQKKKSKIDTSQTEILSQINYKLILDGYYYESNSEKSNSKILREFGLFSLFACPIYIENKVEGFILFEFLTEVKSSLFDGSSTTILTELFSSLFNKIKFIEEKQVNEDQVNKILTAIEQSPNSIVITDLNGSIEYVNPMFCSITGYSKEEAIGQNPKILKSGLMDEDEYKILWDTIKNGEVWKGELLNIKKDGTEFWEMASISAIKNKNNEITQYIAIKEDISKRKRDEETQKALFEITRIIHETENMKIAFDKISYILKSVIKTDNFYLAIYDKNKNELYFPFFKDEKDKVVRIDAEGTMTLYAIKRNKTQKFDIETIEEAKKNNEISNIGTTPLIWIGVPIRINNEPIGLIAVQDYEDGKKFDNNSITIVEFVANQFSVLFEREKSKEQIAADKEELKTILESLNDAVITTDVDGKIIFANKPIEAIFNLRRDTILNKTINTLFWGSEDNGIERLKYYINDIRRGVIKTLEDKFTITYSQGKKRIITVNTSLIFNTDNKVKNILFIIKDITEKLQNENRIALSQKMESVGQLASGIAHEINSPMQFIGDNTSFLQDSFISIMGFLDELNKLQNKYPEQTEIFNEINKMYEEKDIEYFKKEIPDAIEQTQTGIERVRKLVLAMKNFAHPSQKQKNYYNVNNAIETTVTISKNEWKYVAEVEFNLKSDLPEILCVVDEINQVLLNIIVNAAQAIGEKVQKGEYAKGTILIETENDDNFIEIKINDNGIGIPKKIISRIYEPFFTTKEVGKGTGQGLPIAHDIIVSKHKGKLLVESQEGKGSTFVIKLPITN